VGFVLAAAFLWLSAPRMDSLVVGIPVSLIGLAIRAWAAGHLEKNLALTDSGPYAMVRNPLYLGTLTAAAGFVIASRRWELGEAVAATFLLVYLPVVELEEQHLRALFSDYGEYAARVRKLIPGPLESSAGGGERPKHFRWSLYRHNREYEALAGFLAGVAVLCWKAFR
jgi:protein-S-isoprenylcysteine O-methyltransferase Ste14